MPTRILIVEDNDATRRALVTLLRLRGYQTHEATTVQGGLAGLDNTDIILLDLMLPDGSGVTILKLIRALGLPIRVIITSAMNPDDYPDLSGADAILPKPYNIERLLSLLEQPALEPV